MFEKLMGLPIDASTHGARIDSLIFWVHVLMLVLFVGWGAFFLYALARFRRGRNPKADYAGVKTHASSYLEALVAVIEVALLVGLSIPFWSWKVSAFPTSPDTVRVRVVAQQFAWNVHYPGPDGVFGRTDIKLVNEAGGGDGAIGLDRNGDPRATDDVVEINQLHIPVNKPVVIELTTKDVIHSFFLPVMRVKQDAIPGMIIPIHLVATKTSDQMREELASSLRLPTAKKLEGIVAMQDYADKSGNVIVKQGKAVTDDVAKKLADAGITEVRVGPRYPAEIACAQLCGLGHYRMKGFLTVDDQKGFEDWLKGEAP
jgi:cytochrome c oxidase subunit II